MKEREHKIMRIIVDREKVEILSVMQTIRADRNSWMGWKCLRVEIPSSVSGKDLRQIHAGCGLVLETLSDAETGTVFLSGNDEVMVFCQHMPESLLQEAGRQCLDVIFSTIERNGTYGVFDVYRDADRLEALHSWKEACDPFHAPEDSGICKSGQKKTDAIVRLHAHEEERISRQPLVDGRKVLLVEDDPVTRWMVRTALKDECLLATAQDAGRALAVYKTYKPDMVLLDINLPDSDGRDLMTRIMKTDPGAYVVMFSSNASVENIAGTMGRGARGFISKPFSRERILHYVRECPSAR